MRKLAYSLLGFAFLFVTSVAAGHVRERCFKCGCQEQIRKVCKAVPETKKVKVTTWECKCEEICIPGRTQTHDCQPTCGRVRGVKKLMKKEVTKEVPSFKWVAVYVCDGCSTIAPENLTPALAK